MLVCHLRIATLIIGDFEFEVWCWGWKRVWDDLRILVLGCWVF